MAENKDNLYPSSTPSVDDILNEIRAIRAAASHTGEQAPESGSATAPKASDMPKASAMPKASDMHRTNTAPKADITPKADAAPKADASHTDIADKSNEAKAATRTAESKPKTDSPKINITANVPSAEQSVRKFTAPSAPKAAYTPKSAADTSMAETKNISLPKKSDAPNNTQADADNGADKLKNFFRKTSESTYKGDTERAKKQIDALFGESDDGMIVKPFEKRRFGNTQVLSAAEINAAAQKKADSAPTVQINLNRLHKAIDNDIIPNVGADNSNSDAPNGFSVALDDENSDDFFKNDSSAEKTDENQDKTIEFSTAMLKEDESEPSSKIVYDGDTIKSTSFGGYDDRPKTDFLSVEDDVNAEPDPSTEGFFEEAGIKKSFEKKYSRPITEPHIQPEEKAEEDDGRSNVIDDYYTVDDAESIRNDLDRRRSTVSKKITFTAVLTAILAALTILPSLSVNLPSVISPFDNAKNFLAVNAVLFGIVVIINLSTIVHGISSLIRLRPDVDTSVGLVSLAAALQSACAFGRIGSVANGDTFMYTAIASFIITLNLIGKQMMLSRTRTNFEFVATAHVKQSCFTADGESARIIADGSVIGTPVIACSKSVINLRDYLSNALCEDPADTMCQILSPVGLVAALVAGAVSYYTKSDTMTALSCVAAVVSACAPITSLIATNLPLGIASKFTRDAGGMISGYNAVDEFSEAECAVIDAEDLFPAGSVDLISLKSVGDFAVDSMILDAASLAITAGGPLADVFDRMIEGRRKMLLKAKDVSYDDRLGLSGTVNGRRIKIGNREFMENGGAIDLPDIELERRLERNGSYAVYLSSDDELCGMFVVKYTADEELCERIQKMSDDGVTLLIKTCDPNITPSLIERIFDIPAETVKIMPSYAVIEYDSITKPSENGGSVIAYDDLVGGFVSAVYAARRMKRTIMLATSIQTVAAILGLGATIFFALTGNLALIRPHFILAYQLISTAAVLIVPQLRKL